MIENKKVLATICARGGSKGVPGKNIKKLAGKPLIIYTLELISKSNYIDSYVISTDDNEIISVCEKYNFKVDFKRPEELAGDKSPRVEAIKHAVKWKNSQCVDSFDIIIDLGVATPFKNHLDIDKSIEKFIQKKSERLTSVTKANRNPYYNMLEENNNKVSLVKSVEKYLTDRRDAPKVYDMNDALNIWTLDSLFKEPVSIKDCNLSIYEMPKERSVDIDEEFDFFIAELMIERGKIEI